MAISKPKVRKLLSNNGKTPKPEATTATTVDHFPMAQYASVLGVHLILMGFTALYVPQTTRLFRPFAMRTTDRPQSDFMETLTADPLLTLIWTCGGLMILQLWWASWVRKWYFEQRARGTEDEIKLDRVRFNNLRFTVSAFRDELWPLAHSGLVILETERSSRLHSVYRRGNMCRGFHAWGASGKVNTPVPTL